MNNDMTNWDKVNNYEFSEIENKILLRIFREYINPKNNSAFEDADDADLATLFLAFRHGWLMAGLIE